MGSKQNEASTSDEEKELNFRTPQDKEATTIKAAYLFTADGNPLISIRWVDSGTPEDHVIGSFVAAIINFGGKRSENKPRNIMLKNAKLVFLKRANYIAVVTGNKYIKTNIIEKFLEKAIPVIEENVERKDVFEHFISAVVTIVESENMKHIGIGDDLDEEEIQLIYDQMQSFFQQRGSGE